MELIAVHQQNAGLDATKIYGNAVNDGVEELVKFKDGADLLCRLLQRQQRIHAALLEDCGWRGKGKRTGGAGHVLGLLGAVCLDSGPSFGMRKKTCDGTTVPSASFPPVLLSDSGHPMLS